MDLLRVLVTWQIVTSLVKACWRFGYNLFIGNSAALAKAALSGIATIAGLYLLARIEDRQQPV